MDPVTDKFSMKIDSKNESMAARRLREINAAGSIKTKTEIVVGADEKTAKESIEQLSKPSQALRKFASALRKLNSF